MATESDLNLVITEKIEETEEMGELDEITNESNDVYDDTLPILIEGWGGKQGYCYPTWKLRWFVLQYIAPSEAESEDVSDAREYFSNHAPDPFARQHNYNVMNDKQNLVLSYFTDDSKKELKEVFRFTQDTCWKAQHSRITCPRIEKTNIKSLHIFCKGSRGSTKLIFIPFAGFQEPTWNELLQPWVLAMEFGVPLAANLFYGSYFDDCYRVQDQVPGVHGRTEEDWFERLDAFKNLLKDGRVFRKHKKNPFRGVYTFLPILLGFNAQEDNVKLDNIDILECNQVHREWLDKFQSKMWQQMRQKQEAGSRANWRKFGAQAVYRKVTYTQWMKIKDAEESELPEDLRQSDLRYLDEMEEHRESIAAADFAYLGETDFEEMFGGIEVTMNNSIGTTSYTSTIAVNESEGGVADIGVEVMNHTEETEKSAIPSSGGEASIEFVYSGREQSEEKV